MERYNHITDVSKYQREIVLLKSKPCAYAKCEFCDYILDNSQNEDEINLINKQILANITGEYGVLEVINSGSIFELPIETKQMIKEIIREKDIKLLFVEAHWIYHNHINKIKEFFDVDIFVKTGLETFDNEFREKVLKKGFNYKSIEELKEFADSVCLMVGINGQTKEMIKKDIEFVLNHFNHATINVYCNNTTDIKADEDLIKWFRKEYEWLDSEEKLEVLWNNTDFGVGK